MNGRRATNMIMAKNRKGKHLKKNQRKASILRKKNKK